MRNGVGKCLSEVMDNEALSPDSLDLSLGLFNHYGITLLSMIMLMISVCEQCQVPLEVFTEAEIAALRTPRDIVDALKRLRAGGEAWGGCGG
jgi:hypothetical protein